LAGISTSSSLTREDEVRVRIVLNPLTLALSREGRGNNTQITGENFSPGKWKNHEANIFPSISWFSVRQSKI
jgi:hypothetical protein